MLIIYVFPVIREYLIFKVAFRVRPVVFNCFRKRVYNANNIKLFDNII